VNKVKCQELLINQVFSTAASVNPWIPARENAPFLMINQPFSAKCRAQSSQILRERLCAGFLEHQYWQKTEKTD
jgi:hypothetical protein